MTGERNWDDGQQHRNLWPGTRWHRFAEPNCLLWESKDAQFSLCSRLQKVTARGSFALPQITSGFFYFSSRMWRQRQDRTFSRSTTRLIRTCAFRTHVKNITGHLKQSLWKTPSRWKLMRHPVCSVDRHKLRFWGTLTNHWWNQLCFVIIWVWMLTWGLGLQLSTCTYICHIINNISLQHTEESTCIQSLLQHILFMLLGAGDLIPLSSYTLLYSAAVTSPIFFYSVLILTLFSSCCPCSELHVCLCKYTESNLKNGKVLILKHILISKVT